MSTPSKKNKVNGSNYQPHLNKDLRKAIMLRSRFKNKANKIKRDVNIAAHKKQGKCGSFKSKYN